MLNDVVANIMGKAVVVLQLPLKQWFTSRQKSNLCQRGKLLGASCDQGFFGGSKFGS